jgi:hypothetical protein
MVTPNFLIIGPAKGGTTSLYYYLQQHPQVYMSPVKEPRFFALEGEDLNFKGQDAKEFVKKSVLNFDGYCDLFKGATNEIAIGEASPLYIYSKTAPEKIKHYLADVKLIAVLRDPVQRAYSSYMHYVREAYEALSFEEALAIEEDRVRENWVYMWHYTRCGFYYEQLSRYFKLFDPNQIKIYLYDDLVADSKGLVKDMFEFLGVDDTFEPDMTAWNASGVPKNRLLYLLLERGSVVRSTLKILPEGFRKEVATSLRRWNIRSKPALALETSERLKEVYRDDVLKLQDLLNRDLSKWLA